MSSLLLKATGGLSQANAVLAYLEATEGIENSWSTDLGEYAARPTVAEWHNCREKGYVVSMMSKNYKRQLNIAFFEHRNSDQICAVKWEQRTLNPPTIDTAKFGDDVYKDKYDVSHEESCGRAYEMSEWIEKQLSAFWEETVND